MRQYFALSFRNIRHRQLRSWLTILGIVVGIALIVSLVSLGKGLENGILQQMRMFGGDLLMIMPGEESDLGMGLMTGETIRDKDVAALKNVEGVDLVVPFDMAFGTVEFKGETKSTTIHGSPIGETKEIYTANRGLSVQAGRWPSRENSAEVVLGVKIASQKYREKVYVGDEIRVKGKKFTVTGILSEVGSSEDDNAVYMSLYNVRKITGKKAGAKMVMARVISGYDQETVAEEIKYTLRQRRGSADVTVLTSEKAQKLVGGIIGAVQMAVMFIALFSIVVGGIGVMNTMYTSVLERRREIGTMKALGATRTNILTIFLIESGVIGVIGGIMGMLAGLGLAKLAEMGAMQAGFKFLQIYVSPELIFGGLLFAFLLGAVSGVLPARQAAKMNPAEALRYE